MHEMRKLNMSPFYEDTYRHFCFGMAHGFDITLSKCMSRECGIKEELTKMAASLFHRI